MKAHIFLIANPKFQLQILCSFEDTTQSVKLNGIPENNFLCIFIIASFPGVLHFLLPLESKHEATSKWNFTKCISEVKVNQLKVKNMHTRMGISTFNKICCTEIKYFVVATSYFTHWYGSMWQVVTGSDTVHLGLPSTLPTPLVLLGRFFP